MTIQEQCIECDRMCEPVTCEVADGPMCEDCFDEHSQGCMVCIHDALMERADAMRNDY